MDRRSWLWRRKSSEKSPGETESSGSVSSHSERFSDDQVLVCRDVFLPHLEIQEAYKASPNHTQSPEVSSNTSRGEANGSMKSLTEKLSAALLNIKAQEELVNQHAKVAEEAVTGWEMAEKEATNLKLQLEAATQRNLALEDRVGHLDGALKECVRQLRQTREDQEQKIHETLVKRTWEFESSKLQLENQLTELQYQLEASNAKASADLALDLQSKLEAAGKEKSSLKVELLAQYEELKIRTIERDLSTQTAETASKQHLESIKKVAKLEADCRRLRFLAHKACSSSNDYKHISSIYVNSLTDSQSDSGDRLNQVETELRKTGSMELNECELSCSNSWASVLVKHGKTSNNNLMASSMELGLMDDFLEMERLAALPEIETGSSDFGMGPTDLSETNNSSPSKSQFKVMAQSAFELEGILQRIEEEKAGLERALAESQDQLKTSRIQLIEAEEKFVELQKEMDLAKELKQTSELVVENVNAKRKMVELQLEATDAEVQALRSMVGTLEVEIEQEKALSKEFKARCQSLEEKIQQERALSAQFKAECRNLEVEIEENRSLSEEVNSMCQSLEKEIERERALSLQVKIKCQNLEDMISRKKQEAEIQRTAVSNGELKINQEKEFAVAAGKLTDCQKTIASLGRQLKSLASLDDFLMDAEMPELKGASLFLKSGK